MSNIVYSILDFFVTIWEMWERLFFSKQNWFRAIIVTHGSVAKTEVIGSATLIKKAINSFGHISEEGIILVSIKSTKKNFELLLDKGFVEISKHDMQKHIALLEQEYIPLLETYSS